MRKIVITIISSLVSLFAVANLYAATATTTFSVTASVASACTISATNLAFGNYIPTSLTPTNGTSSIDVLCTNGTPYNVRLNQGLNGATVTTRQMLRIAGIETLNYGLFLDPAHTLNWGETDGTDDLAAVGTGASQLATVYGQIPASQNVPAGSYSDTITATINF